MKRLLLLTMCVLLSSGCATYKLIEGPPRATGKNVIEFSEDTKMGMNEMPMGIYKVPDSRVAVSGDFKGGMTGMFFGLTGFVVQDAINKRVAKKTAGNLEDHFRWDLNEDLKDISREILNSDAKFSGLSLADDAGENGFVVYSHLLIDYVEDIGVIPYIFLKANKFDNKKRVWTARYIASAGEAKPMSGTDGWINEDNRALKRGVRTAMTKALNVLYEDMIDPYPRTKEKDKIVKPSLLYPYFSKPVKFPGWIIKDDGQTVVFTPKVGDAMVMAGMNIFDKDEVDVSEYQPLNEPRVLPGAELIPPLCITKTDDRR